MEIQKIRKRMIITDLDNTVVMHNYNNEVQRLCKCAGIPYFEEIENEFYNFLFHFGEYVIHTRITHDSLAKVIEELMPVTCMFIPAAEFLRKWRNFDSAVYTKESEEVLRRLKEQGYKVIAFTDWFGKEQRKVLSKLGYLPYFDMVYGWDNSFAKPDGRALRRIIKGNAKEDCLLIGDSLEKDIACANSEDITSIWLNSQNRVNTTAVQPDYTISDILQVLDIL